MRKALTLGIVASFFFGFTFVLNRQMNLTGGSWIWSACLRFLFMLPILWLLAAMRGELRPVLAEIRRQPVQWFLWSTVGFGLFYAPLSAASVFGPSWLIAGTWQLTVVSGALLAPLFFTVEQRPDGAVRVRCQIPRRPLVFGAVILVGVAMMQLQEAVDVSVRGAVFSTGLVLIAAIAYPLGNRKMMEVCAGRLGTLQRVLGMTLCSLPVWLLMAGWGLVSVGAPSGGQMLQALAVAVCSGVVATLLFFYATNLVRNNQQQLAVVESTISLEVVFVLLGGVLIFRDQAPAPLAILGLALVVVGMLCNSLLTEGR